ncbi:MAG: Rossmann-like and DUF2520 domain-containing protein [Planctomycetota bacterium]
MEARPRIGIIGGGVVGSALGRALRAAGYTVSAVASRQATTAAAAASFIAGDDGEAPAVTDAAGVAAAADLVICAVPDRTIAAVGAQLGAGPLRPELLVVHCAGALEAAELQPVADAGARIGGLHPLQSFAGPEEAVALLPGSVFGIEGTDAVRAELTALVEALGGIPLPIQPGGKVRYHAAAAIISNYTTVLARAASGLLASIGSDDDRALAALLPLLRGTVDNLGTVGLPGALTGPIARGDAPTVAAHLADLRAHAPTLVASYVALGKLAVALALEKGSIDDAAAARLYDVLGDTP